jgi:hypothetical protein
VNGLTITDVWVSKVSSNRLVPDTQADSQDGRVNLVRVGPAASMVTTRSSTASASTQDHAPHPQSQSGSNVGFGHHEAANAW